ncbi:MAG TPA: GAF domain-containing protein, partial [Anaerolineales bacterium]|nr:GAF domain-containing protein [Anaerolineales bacterium]
AETPRSVFLIFLFTLISIAIVMAIASTNFQRNLYEIRRNELELRERNIELDRLKTSLEMRVTERTAEIEKRANQLEAISSVARSTASLQSLEDLLPAITRLVSERFDFYHTGIFLTDDEQEFAVLRAANSDGGRKMLNRQHKLKLDTNSIVGFVTSRGEPRIALDVGSDAVFFDNPDLPDTRSEMALPLRVGKRVIGALDVQSTQPNAFTEADVNILSTLADQVAIAIENAHLFGEAREALNRSEETFSQYVQQEWSTFAKQIKTKGYIFDGVRTTPLDSKEALKKQRELPKTGNLSLEKAPRELSIPIKFRGQVIGILDVKPKSSDRKWTQDDITLLETAAERTALALENTRLVESSQRRAARERTIGEISSKIGTVTDIEAIMQTTVEELGRKIGGAAEVIFELDTEQEKS